MRAMFFAPQMVSLVVIAVVWQMMSADKHRHPRARLRGVGIPDVSLLGNPNIALYTVVFISRVVPHGLLHDDLPRWPPGHPQGLLRGGARSTAPSWVERFWYITLPLLKPTSFFVLLTSLVAAVAGGQAFDLIYVMTKGGPANATQLIVVYIYQQAFQYRRLRLRCGDGLDPRRHPAADHRHPLLHDAGRTLLL